MNARPLPRPPFAGWPVQRYDELYGFAWYTEPGALITQTTVVRATVECVERLNDAIDDVFAFERTRLLAQGGLVILHDWRGIQSYESSARRAFLDRMKAREKGYLKTAIVGLSMSPLLRMAVETANLFAAVALGRRIQIVNKLETDIARFNVSVPAPGSQFPPARGGR